MAGRPNMNEFQPESWRSKAGKIGQSFKSSKKDSTPSAKTASSGHKPAAARKPANAGNSQKPAALKKPSAPKGSDIKSPPRDWTREKEGAAKAGTAVKNGVVTGAVATKDGSVKAYGWLASKMKGKGDASRSSNAQLSGY